MTIHWHFEKSSPQTVRTGESLDQSAGSRGTVTQYNSGAENIIQFPSGRTFLPDSRATERELSIRERDRYALAGLGALVVSALISIACLLYVGNSIFDLVYLG